MFALLEEIHKRFPEQEHLSISYAWGGRIWRIPGRPSLYRAASQLDANLEARANSAELYASGGFGRLPLQQPAQGQPAQHRRPPKANISQVIVDMRGMRE